MARAALEREKQLVLRSIKELEFDRAMGRVADPSRGDAMAVTWLAMLIFFDTVFVTLALWTFDAVMTE